MLNRGAIQSPLMFSMAVVLGVSAFYHDSAAAVLVDGKVVAAAQEERFTRRKHDSDFPHLAVAYCLKQAGQVGAGLDCVAFYEKPFLKLDRLVETVVGSVPKGYLSFRKAVPAWIRERQRLAQILRESLPDYRGKVLYPEHHESHAASAFFPSPFDEAAILTTDGVGEWATSCLGVGHHQRIELHQELRFPNSLGLLYSAFTSYLGFKVNSGEYKIMGLAPYGEPTFRDVILNRLIDLKEDGSYRLNQRFFNYTGGLTMTSSRFHKLFGGPPRQAESLLTQREMNLAASIQSVAEEVLLRTACYLHQRTGMRNLVLAGGVALNCAATGQLLRTGPFEQIWVQPASGDAGGALGAAALVAHQLMGDQRQRGPGGDGQHASWLGPEYTDAEIQDFLERQGATYQRFESEQALCAAIAAALSNGRVVGWFQGRMEYGPRALGSRSILADARHPDMQTQLNLKIKFRESFRPFAPIVLREHVADYFDVPPGYDSPYMNFVVPVKSRHLLPSENESIFGIERLKQPRSTIPAITHVDNTARIQTVDPERHPLLARLLQEFAARTGVPVLVNTSFNIRGEPIVCTPADAYRCFMMTGIDVLAVGRFVLDKSTQSQQANPAEQAAHRRQFDLD